MLFLISSQETDLVDESGTAIGVVEAASLAVALPELAKLIQVATSTLARHLAGALDEIGNYVYNVVEIDLLAHTVRYYTCRGGYIELPYVTKEG